MNIQWTWEEAVTTAAYNNLLTTCSSPIDRARLKGVVTLRASNWLHASPHTAIDLRLSDEAISEVLAFA